MSKTYTAAIFMVAIHAVCIQACGFLDATDNDTNSSGCSSLTEASCASINKKLDIQNCICVEKSSQPSNQCSLTEASCASINKKLDIQNCICVEKSAQPSNQCGLTEASCLSENNKFLDSQNCKCTYITYDADSLCPQSFDGATETYCRSNNKILDTQNCVCINPSTCNISEAECQSVNHNFDSLYCRCIDKKTNYSIGDLIQFGHYEQDNDESNGKEPITWRVLEVKSDRLLVMSEMIIDAILFNYSNVVQDYISWEGSDIRDWLNGYISTYQQDPLGVDTRPNFYDSAFNATEKEFILTTTVLPHAGHQGDGVDQGKETNDKLFLLSMYEHRKYFNGDHCIAYITPYGDRKKSSGLNCIGNIKKIDGIQYNTGCRTGYFLRTMGLGGPIIVKAYDNRNEHCFYSRGTDANIVYGIRPAMWLKIPFE